MAPLFLREWSPAGAPSPHPNGCVLCPGRPSGAQHLVWAGDAYGPHPPTRCPHRGGGGARPPRSLWRGPLGLRSPWHGGGGDSDPPPSTAPSQRLRPLEPAVPPPSSRHALGRQPLQPAGPLLSHNQWGGALAPKATAAVRRCTPSLALAVGGVGAQSQDRGRGSWMPGPIPAPAYRLRHPHWAWGLGYRATTHTQGGRAIGLVPSPVTSLAAAQCRLRGAPLCSCGCSAPAAPAPESEGQAPAPLVLPEVTRGRPHRRHLQPGGCHELYERGSGRSGMQPHKPEVPRERH